MGNRRLRSQRVRVVGAVAALTLAACVRLDPPPAPPPVNDGGWMCASLCEQGRMGGCVWAQDAPDGGGTCEQTCEAAEALKPGLFLGSADTCE